MKYTLVFAGLVAGALAGGECSATQPSYYSPPSESTPNPSPKPSLSPNDQYFAVMSLRSASPIHFALLTARGGKFYLGGGPPSSYCPECPVVACPSGENTVLAGGNKTLSLAVAVPGGQQVYVAPDGALSYTQAHSAFIPEGSIVDQFSRTAPSNGSSYGYLRFNSSLVACPVNGTGPGFQVYSGAQNSWNTTKCLGFIAATLLTDELGAYQY